MPWADDRRADVDKIAATSSTSVGHKIREQLQAPAGVDSGLGGELSCLTTDLDSASGGWWMRSFCQGQVCCAVPLLVQEGVGTSTKLRG